MSNELIKNSSGELVAYTRQDFITEYNPASLKPKVDAISTTKELIRQKDTALAVRRKEFDQETVTDILELHLFDLIESINVHKTLSGPQIQDLAQEIVNTYYFLSVLEIAHIFRRAKRGDFGPFKFSLNQADVIEWFKSYQNERTAEFDKQNYNIHKEVKTGHTVWNKEKEMFEKRPYSHIIDEMAPDILLRLKEQFPDVSKAATEEEFRAFKNQLADNPEHSIIDQSNNEELNKLKQKIKQKYGING